MFAPEDMRPQEAELTVTTEDVSEEGSIVWHYPIGGQPRLRPVSPSVAPHIQCTAKERLEQRLEVCLAGSAGVAQPRLGESGAVTLRPVTPGSGGDGGGLLEPLGVMEGVRYQYRLVCGDPDVGPLLEQCTGVRLMRSEESPTGDAVLVFGIVFSPSKPFRYMCMCVCVCVCVCACVCVCVILCVCVCYIICACVVCMWYVMCSYITISVHVHA